MTVTKNPLSSLVLQDQGETAPRMTDKVNRWISNTAGSETDGTVLEPNCNYSEHLYELLLKTLRQLCASLINAERAKESLTKLFLWGREFRHGRLTLILSNATELEENICNSLEEIGRLVLAQYDQDGDLTRSSFVDDLRGLLKLEQRNDALDEGGSCTDVVSTTCLANRLSSDSTEVEALHSESDDDCQSVGSISVFGEDFCDSLQNEISNLLDLLPAIEQSYARLQLSCANPAGTKGNKEFSVTPAALPFVRNVADKFQNAETTLVERLGESNWQRFMMIRARKDKIYGTTQEIAHIIPPLSLPDVFKKKEMPKSVFVPQTLFYDSGLGTSVPTTPSYAPSNASHSSFLSSLVAEGEKSLRVPKTPTAVAVGETFICEICGEELSKIRNRIDWKRHVFEDLQPYICTFPDCEKHLVKFATRTRWAEHEFNEHRRLQSWKCPECTMESTAPAELEDHLRTSHFDVTNKTDLALIVASAAQIKPAPIDLEECPLCQSIPGKSKRNFVTHLARHLESIALAVLPREAEEDSDRDSQSSSSAASQATSALQAGPKDLELSPSIELTGKAYYEAHWTDEETTLLFHLAFLDCEWSEIAQLIGSKTAEQCLLRFSIQRVPWAYQVHELTKKPNRKQFRWIDQGLRARLRSKGLADNFDRIVAFWFLGGRTTLKDFLGSTQILLSNTKAPTLLRTAIGSDMWLKLITKKFNKEPDYFNTAKYLSASMACEPSSIAANSAILPREALLHPLNPDLSTEDISGNSTFDSDGVHQGSRGCPIKTCGSQIEQFSSQSDFMRHVGFHYQKSLICNFCPERLPRLKCFDDTESFKGHLLMEPHQKIPALCPVCSNAFYPTAHLFDHLDTCLTRAVFAEQHRYFCWHRNCFRHFETEVQLQEHRYRAHQYPQTAEGVIPVQMPASNEYFLDGEGIDRQVLEWMICEFLGPEASCWPFHRGYQLGYKFVAQNPFTPAMIEDLKLASRDFAQENNFCENVDLMK